MTPDDRQAATLEALDEQYARVERLFQAGYPGEVADLDGLRGRRSILVRHAPELCQRRQCGTPHWICASHGTAWEDCPDWRDAAAGLEVPDGG